MRLGKEIACGGVGLMLSLLLVGCVSSPSAPSGAPMDGRAFTPRPQPTAVVSDLRIPRESLVSAEIPIVPLPTPPRPTTGVPVGNPRNTVPSMPPATDAGTPLTPTAPAAATDIGSTPPAATVVGMDNVRRLHKLAVERYDGIDSYIARLTRREQLRGENKPEEVMEFRFRKEPWSVYFKWLSANGRGREVIYVNGQYENKLQTLLAAGDMPLAPAGKRMALATDSIFVRTASRHPVTEAGLGASIIRLGRILDALDRGDQRKGTLTDLGLIPRPEFARPVAAIEHAIPPGLDPNLPRGGRCLYCFDPESNLPVVVAMRDHTGQEVEYYFYDRLQYPVRLDDNDFNPDKLWGRSRPRQ